MMSLLTLVCSPYRASDPRQGHRNRLYARLALRHSIFMGELPHAPHVEYPEVLDDNHPSERERGMHLSLDFLHRAERIAIYGDLGISDGMAREIRTARVMQKEILYRSIHQWHPRQNPDSYKQAGNMDRILWPKRWEDWLDSVDTYWKSQGEMSRPLLTSLAER